MKFKKNAKSSDGDAASISFCFACLGQEMVSLFWFLTAIFESTQVSTRTRSFPDFQSSRDVFLPPWPWSQVRWCTWC